MDKTEKTIGIIIVIIVFGLLLNIALKETSDIEYNTVCDSDYFGGTECY